MRALACSAAAYALLALLLGSTQSVRAACAPFDHSHDLWEQLTARWVANGGVAYAALLREDEQRLDTYLKELSATCADDYETWSGEQRLAFWINTYNAYTVRLILDHYPLSSIRRIGFLPGAAFRKKFIPMQGLKEGEISLDVIEHDILRADFQEPRVHFALVCAARSCPPLREEAYRAPDLEAQLDDQARRFLRNEAKNRFDAASGTLYLSEIFDWFSDDFVTDTDALPAYVAPYMADPRAAHAERVEFLPYDWALNEVPNPAADMPNR